MTLCISFKHFNRAGIYDQAFTIADTRLTVIRTVKSEKALSLLPNDVKIVHQNDCGIKTHIIKYKNKHQNKDIVVAVAGAVSLGLQSAIYLDATLTNTFGVANFKKILSIIDETIEMFWKNAYDKDIEYLITLPDDENKTRIFKKVGRGNNLLPIEEVFAEYGCTIGVIGDKSDQIKNDIYTEINTLITVNRNIATETAVEIACVRALRREIEDESNLFVGGAIQSVAIKGKDAYYMGVRYNECVFFRGVNLGEEIIIGEYPIQYPLYPYNWELYNPQKTLQEISQLLLND